MSTWLQHTWWPRTNGPDQLSQEIGQDIDLPYPHYNNDNDKTQEKQQKQQEYGHCLITLSKSKIFSGTQIITANSQYPQHKCNTCKKGYVPIAYAPQESTGVQDVSVIILHVPKTIFQHQAELSH